MSNQTPNSVTNVAFALLLHLRKLMSKARKAKLNLIKLSLKILELLIKIK
jgi:hypothetical protein